MIILGLIVFLVDAAVRLVQFHAEENVRLRAQLWEEQRLRRVEQEAHRTMREVTRRTIEAMLDEATWQQSRRGLGRY